MLRWIADDPLAWRTQPRSFLPSSRGLLDRALSVLPGLTLPISTILASEDRIVDNTAVEKIVAPHEDRAPAWRARARARGAGCARRDRRRARRPVKLTISHVRIPMRYRFGHARTDRSVADNIVVEAELADGTRGWGECVREYVTGEP